MTAGQSRALRAAGIYLSSAAFSSEGLREQLVFDGYSAGDAEYAVLHCGADWQKQALRSACGYLSLSAFSESGLRAQLLLEKFTEAEVGSALSSCHADWNEQAARCAERHLHEPGAAYTAESLFLQLRSDGFSESQARIGASRMII